MGDTFKNRIYAEHEVKIWLGCRPKALRLGRVGGRAGPDGAPSCLWLCSDGSHAEVRWGRGVPVKVIRAPSHTLGNT